MGQSISDRIFYSNFVTFNRIILKIFLSIIPFILMSTISIADGLGFMSLLAGTGDLVLLHDEISFPE